jgi:hypothetical protein
VLSLASEESLIQALSSPAPSANLLSMTVVHKAAQSPADAAILSTMGELVAAFVRRWLVAPQVEVGQKGGKVLGDLLDVDCELPPPPPSSSADAGMQVVLRKVPGQGKLWRRVFGDPAVYGLILGVCSGQDPATADDEKQLSLAQGRLLRVLPHLAALNFRAVASPNPTAVGLVSRTSSSLLQFAALHMIDGDDELMRLSLVDFFEAFVSLMRVTDYSTYKVETIRSLVREAAAADSHLKDALLTLPDRTVPEEADDLRRWLREIMPGEAVRIDGRWV